MTVERIYCGLAGHSHLFGSATDAASVVEYGVHAALARHVAQVTVYREALPGAAVERLLPDGAVRLVFDLAGSAPQVFVAGPTASAVSLPVTGTVAHLTLTLRSGAAAQLLGSSIAALRDRCVSLTDLWSNEAVLLAEQIREAGDDGRRVFEVQRYLVTRLDRPIRSAAAAPRLRDDWRVREALEALATGATAGLVAGELGVGERRLQQLFATEVGLSPREMRKIFRIQSCLHSFASSPGSPLSEVALSHGFFDQAHFCNEFKQVVGLTPTEFLAVVDRGAR